MDQGEVNTCLWLSSYRVSNSLAMKQVKQLPSQSASRSDTHLSASNICRPKCYLKCYVYKRERERERERETETERSSYLIFGISRTLVVISAASGAIFSTLSSTDQNSFFRDSIPFLAEKRKNGVYERLVNILLCCICLGDDPGTPITKWTD